MILILTNELDVSADYVVKALQEESVDFLRVNTEALPKHEVSIVPDKFRYEISAKSRKYDLVKELRSVWLRRPGKPFDNQFEKPALSEPIAKYVTDHWRTYLEGLTSIDNVFWINDPYRNRNAENKIIQLREAIRTGLRIPRTCITSSKKEALSFFEHCNHKIIGKALDTPLIEYPDKDYFIFTNTLESLDDISEDEFNISPTILQERLFPKIDYRVTIIGSHCFTVKVEYPANPYEIDWRSVKEKVEFEPSEIPKHIQDGCMQLVKRLGLVFGAIDLVYSNNDYYFLEINPNGEWGWLQKRGVPIAEAIAACLIERNVGASAK